MTLHPFRYCFGLLLLIWLAGFGVFLESIPQKIDDPNTPTDAIVVLTGSKGRVQLGFQLMRQGLAKKLFISGVHPDVKLPELLSPRPSQDGLNTWNDSETKLGYKAQNTRGNAKEVQVWAQQNQIDSVRLVTNDYHIKRSMMLFRRQMPEITLIPHPLFEKKNWSFKTLLSFWGEYHKFLRDFIFS